jgi:hypothetical protein
MRMARGRRTVSSRYSRTRELLESPAPFALRSPFLTFLIYLRHLPSYYILDFCLLIIFVSPSPSLSSRSLSGYRIQSDVALLILAARLVAGRSDFTFVRFIPFPLSRLALNSIDIYSAHGLLLDV